MTYFTSEMFIAFCIFLHESFWGYIMWIVDIIMKQPKSMDGKIVVITGGASGIGKEVAQMFSNLGAKIALLDINKELNEKTANEINENAGLAISFTVDITKPDKLKEIAIEVQRHPNLGDPDVVICNAGVLWPKLIMELTDEDIRRTIDINLLGYFWTVRAFLPRMMENNKGHIAAVCSVSAYFGSSYISAYSASKFGVRGLMESLEWELYDNGKHNVKVTTVYPYITKSPLLKPCNIKSRLFRLLTVEKAASTIVNAILYEKAEAYTTPIVSFWCNFLKSTAPERLKLPFKRFADIRFK